MSAAVTAIAAIVGGFQRTRLRGNDMNLGKGKMNPGVAIALGTAIGIAIGSAMHQLAIGLALGVSFGVALGAFTNRKQGTRNKEQQAE